MAAMMRPYVERGELPAAISILVRDDAEEVACVGWADAARRRPLTLDSLFMQCSQTKGFCGVTIAKLVEEGRLGLDDPVAKYLPEFARLTVRTDVTNDTYRVVPAKNVLTVRMVMNHTGGLGFEVPNYERMGGWSRRMPLRSAAALAAALPLETEPGTQQGYSNLGIDVGAAVVEVVTGCRWEDYLSGVVLEPLGMTSSTFRPTAEQLEARMRMYRVAGTNRFEETVHDAMQPPYGDDRVFPSAGAGLWTTARDQLKFYRMLMNLGIGDNGVRILREQTVKDLLAVSTRPTEMEGYSLGLRAPRTTDDGEDAWFGHGGAWGTRCMVNWRRRQLNLWVVQVFCEAMPEFDAKRAAIEKAFFGAHGTRTGVESYTGRIR